MIKIYQILVLLCLFSGIKSGRVLNGDIWVDYANAGSMTELSFSFMLQNSIDQYDYIKAALPFPLHSSLVPAYPATEGLSLPSGLQVTYQHVDDSSNIQPMVYTCQVLTETIDSSTYFIRFYDSDRKTIVPISKNQWFYLKFTIQDTDPLQYQKASSILQVQLSTVSSVWSNAMVYDDNLAFNYFELGSAPSQSITLAVTPYEYGSAGGYLLTQAEYDLYLDVTMNISSYQFQQNLKLIFFIDQEDSFSWNGSCSSVAKTNSPKINQLNSTYYTCTVDNIKNLMTVVLTPQALATQTSYRFTVGVKNPPIVIKDVDVTVKAVKEVSGLILAYGTDTAALSTNQIYVTYQQIFVGWGLRPDALLPFDARVFRGDAATPNYMPYNSLSIKFNVSQTTSSEVELKIQISIPSQSSAYVLPNGYTHNLPAFPNKDVACVVQFVSDTTNRKIACTGVGSLQVGEVYYVGWKMYFPYDNYESSIDCTQFGLLTVYTVQTITQQDNVFILGRGDEFLEFMKGSLDYYVIGRNSSYITYMKTFANLNLVVLSSDFQQFLQYPEQIVVTNRPSTFTDKKFNDVYVVGQNLAFMTYLQSFDDLYVAYKLKADSDIAKGYDETPLIATSMPKNTLSIKTSNSKNWADYTTDQMPIISSATTSAATTVDSSLLKNAGTDQYLTLKIAAQYSDVTSADSTAGTPIDDNWGMIIMMNPKIKLNGNIALTSNDFDVAAETIDSGTDYNQYTLITLRASLSDQLLAYFPVGTPTKHTFEFSPFLIEDFGSLVADQDNFDIMIATIDGIDGPLNTITYNGFFLINGFSLAPSSLTTVKTSFVAYCANCQMDGSQVPSLLRVKGDIAGTTNFNTLNIFFDKLTPYFENYHNNDVYCYSTDGAPYCKFYKGAEDNVVIYNYHTYSRIQIALAAPATSFDILIPIKGDSGKTNINMYVGYSEVDSATGRILNAFVQPREEKIQAGGISTSFTTGPDITGVMLGDTVTPLSLNAKYSGVSMNSAANWGGAFLYFSEWDYFGDSTPSGWTMGPCYKMQYLQYETGGVYALMKGVVCFTDTAASSSAAVLSFPTGYIPTKWGLVLPGYGAYSQNTGNLQRLRTNNNPISTLLTIADTTTITTPTSGPSQVNAVGQWVIPLPVAIGDDIEVLIQGTSGNIPFNSADGTCCVNVNNIKMPIGCTYTSSTTEVDYILTINQRDLLPAGTQLQIIHYGMDTNVSTSLTVTTDLTVYTLTNTNSPSTNDVIFSATGLTFKYNTDDATYISASVISLSSYHQVTNNKAAITSFNFSFSVLGKGLYDTERVRINLGQYYTDNSASVISPKCKIYEYTVDGSPQFSHEWSAVDTSQGLNKLEFWPQRNMVGQNLTYTVKCINFVATSTSSPTGISGKVVNQSSSLTGQISTTSSIALATLTALSASNQITASKKFTIPSSQIEVEFTVTSPGITTDSIMYIGFPSYYANGLGPSIKCYSTNQILCKVTNRELMIRYIGTYASGISFVVTVVGVSQPVNYNSGTFYFVIDDDDDKTTVLSSGTFADTVSASVLDTQNFPAFQILSFSQSSYYLRQQGIQLDMTFYVPTTLSSVTVGQYLFLVFPPNFGDVLRFISPTCVLNIRGNTLKNYISSCTVKGLRLKMPFLDDLVLGSVYSLTINGLINPTNPSSYVYKYALQITSASGSSIIARSFSPHANFEMPIFIVNPIRQSLNYYTETDGLITELTTTVNIQSQQIFISTGTQTNSTFYSRNVYLEPLNNLYSIPSSINLLAGQNPFPIRLSALTSGINYIYFSKTGDGSYYSNLPPLMLSINKNYDSSFNIIETGYNLPVAAVNTNYTIGVNLPFELYPMTEVSINVSLSSTAKGISLRSNPTVITFYPQKTSATIKLYINDALLWQVGETVDLILTPANSNTYASAATVPLVATSAVSALPTLTLTETSTQLKRATFDVTCTQNGRFIYHISRKFSYNTTACTLTKTQIEYWIEQSSIDGLRVDQTYYNCLDYLGMANIVTPGTPQTLTIQDLQASLDYNIVGYCQTQIGTQSDEQQISFSTNSNGGYVSKMDFYFQSQLTPAQKIKLVCALALMFQINYEKVSTADGYYCSELLTSRRVLFAQEQSRLLQGSGQRIQVYFGVNTQLNQDDSPATVNTESITQTNIENQLANVVGLPALVSMQPSVASYTGSNSLVSGFYVDVGPNYVYVQGLSMSNNGLIYIIIGQDSLWSRAPVIGQIKKGSGPNGLPPVYFKVLAYRTGQADTGNAAFTGMGNEKLKMYIMTSDDNPFDNAIFGGIKSYTIQSEVPTWERTLTLMTALFIILLLF